MDQATVKPAKPASPAAGGSPLYGLGMVGAAVYYVKRADTKKEYALALPKALVWPATLVYRLLGDSERTADRAG